MNDFRYKRILFLQAILLSFSGIAFYRLTTLTVINNTFANYWIVALFFWLFLIVLNLFFLKHIALPSKSILKTVSPASSPEEMSWSIIEETFQQKNQDMLALKEQYELENLKYKTLLDSLLDPVCIYDQDLNITYANHAFENFFRVPVKNRAVPLIEITRNLDYREILKVAQRSETPHKVSNFTFNQLQDPHKIFFEIKIFPMKNLSGHLCLMHDITQMKMAELMREDFVANFSHEVRTPLTILNGQLQNLRQSLAGQEDPSVTHVFQRIDNNSRRLINLFNDLLRLTSVERKLELHKEEIDIGPLVETICEELALNYPGKKITFRYEIQNSHFWIDYNLFEQVLINLIDNSLKYIAQEGLITIKAFIETVNGEEFNVMEISDNGVGIPEDQVHRIFERFFRVDNSRSSEIQGTGLGLAIVKHIIQKHDGKIKAWSRPSQGTVFTIAIPRKPNSQVS